MKKFHIILSIVAAFCAVSCDGFLTKLPETQLSPETFFRTENELELFTNGFYASVLPSPTSCAEQVADDHFSSSLSAIQKGTRLPSSKSWAGIFDTLRDVNYFLEKNVNCDEATREKYNGVAYFFRAMIYFEMVRQFGDMPYYDKVLGSTDTKELTKPRDPRGYVMMKVLEDCDRAYERLPEDWGSDSQYRLSKDAALALKSRAALFEGTFRKYHAGTEYLPVDEQVFDGVTVSSEWFLRQAADAAALMIGSRSLYSGNEMKLDPKRSTPYREYFLLEDAEKNETILARRYAVELAIRHGIQFDYKNARHSATQRFVDHYLLANGKPVSSKAGYQNMSYAEQFKDRDPRLAQTIQGPDYIAAGESEHEVLSWERTLSGYRIIKFISDSSHEGATTSTTDYPVFRYAEVLLNYAEAKAELGELTKADVNATIDLLRARVGMTKMGDVPADIDPMMEEYYPNAKGSQKAAILEIRRERTVELFSEGFRQWDLLRWGEGKWLCPSATGGFKGIYVPALGEYDLDADGRPDVLFYKKGSKPSSVSSSIAATAQIEIGGNFTISADNRLCFYAAENYQWNDACDYLWPIPADQRTATGGNLSQNPGWDDGLSF